MTRTTNSIFFAPFMYTYWRNSLSRLRFGCHSCCENVWLQVLFFGLHFLLTLVVSFQFFWIGQVIKYVRQSWNPQYIGVFPFSLYQRTWSRTIKLNRVFIYIDVDISLSTNSITNKNALFANINSVCTLCWHWPHAFSILNWTSHQIRKSNIIF